MDDRTRALFMGANELEDSQNTSVSMLPLQSATRSAMGKLGLNAHRPMPTHLAPSQGAKHYNYGPGPMRTNFGPGHRPSNWSPSPMMPIVHRDSSSLDRSTAVRGLERPVSRSLDRCPSSLLDRGMGVHEMDVMATGFGYYGNHGALGDMEAAVTSSKPNNPQNSASKSKTKISAKKKSEGSSLDWMTSAPLGPTIPFTSRKYSAPLKPIASRSSKPLAQTKPSITTLSDNNLLTQARRQNEPLKSQVSGPKNEPPVIKPLKQDVELTASFLETRRPQKPDVEETKLFTSVPMPHRQDWVQQARASLKPAPLGAIKSKEDGISSAGWLTQARASLTPPTSPPPARAHWLDSDSELADDIMDKLRNEQENKPIHRLSAVMANVQKDMHYLDHSVQDVSGEKNKRQEVNQVTDINEKNKESNETLSAISEISEACITTKQEILKEIEASVDRAQIVTVLKSEILNGVEIPAVDDPECLKHNISKDESNPHMLAAITHANTEPSENTDSQQNPTSKNKYTNEELNNEIKKMLSERKIVRNSGPLEKTVFDEIQDSDDRIVIAEKKLEKQDCSIETHENGITNYEDDKSKISPELPMGCLYENKATLNDINSTKAIGDQYHTNTNDQFEELILERKKLRNQKSLHPICATIVSQKSKSSQADLCLAVPLPPNYKVPNNRFVTADENEEDVEFINLSVEDTVQGECLPAQVTEKQRASSLSLEAPSAQHEGSNRDDKFFEIDKKTKMQSMSITSPLERLSKEGFNVIQSFQSVKGNKPKHAQVKINDNCSQTYNDFVDLYTQSGQMLHSEGKASKPYSRLEIQKEKDKLLKESMSLLREACQKFTKRTAVMGKADNGPTKFQNITEEKLIIMQQHCLIEQLHLRLKICEAKLENKDRELENKDRENKEYFRHTNESLMKYQSKRSSLLEPKTTSTQLIVNSPKVFERKRKQLSRSNKGKSLFGEHMKNSSRDMPCSKNIGSTRAPMINAPETSRRKKQMKNQQTTMDFRKRWEQTELPKRGNLKDFRTITKLIGTECLVTKSDLHNNACEVLEQEIESQPGNRRWKPKANTRQNKPLGAEKEDQDVERKNISLRLKQKTLGKHHYESADKSDDQIKYEDIHVEKASFNHPESAVENIVIKNQMTLNEHNFTFIKEKTTEVSSIDIKSMEYFSSKEQKELEHTNKDNDARVSLLCGMKRRKPRRKKVTENQTNCEIKSKHQICAAIENFVDKMKAKWFDESVNKDRIQTHDSKETAQENLTNFSHSTQTQELGTGTFHSSKKQIVKCDILQINQQENIDEKSYGSKIRSSKQEKEIITEIGGPLKTTKLKWFGKLQNKREINQNITVNNTHPALDDSASVKILEIDVHTDEKMLAANTSNRNENEMCQNELKRIADLFRVVNKQTDSECTVDKKSDSEENIDKKKILAEAQCLIKRDQAKHFSKQKESFIDNPDISHAAVIQKSVDADKLDVKKRVKESNDITLNVKNISPMTPDDEESDTNSSDTELAVSEVNTRPKSRIFGIFKQQYSSEGKANHLQAPKDAFDDTHNIKNLKKKSYDTELGEKEGSPNTPADKESDIDYSDTELAISELNTRPKSRIFGIFKHQNSPDGKTNQQLPPRDVWKAFQEQTDEQNITAEDNKMDIRDIELKENYMKQPKSDIFRMIKGKFFYKEGNKTKISRRCC